MQKEGKVNQLPGCALPAYDCQTFGHSYNFIYYHLFRLSWGNTVPGDFNWVALQFPKNDTFLQNHAQSFFDGHENMHA